LKKAEEEIRDLFTELKDKVGIQDVSLVVAETSFNAFMYLKFMYFQDTESIRDLEIIINPCLIYSPNCKTALYHEFGHLINLREGFIEPKTLLEIIFN
jgi:Zn-dependent peptidase ImmA (M78 family)